MQRQNVGFLIAIAVALGLLYLTVRTMHPVLGVAGTGSQGEESLQAYPIDQRFPTPTDPDSKGMVPRPTSTRKLADRNTTFVSTIAPSLRPKLTSRPNPPSALPSWAKKLYTPTYITFAMNVWFIVDCWHHRVLFSAERDAPVEEWRDLDQEAMSTAASEGLRGAHADLKIPHTVAADDELLLTESSVGGSEGANHSVLVYAPKVKGDGSQGFDFVAEIVACPLPQHPQGTRRPHRLSYDPITKAFYLYLTNPPSLAKFVRKPKAKSIQKNGDGRTDQGWTVELEFCQELTFMKGIYARSFALKDGFMYLTAGPAVMKVDYAAASKTVAVKVVKAYAPKLFGLTKGKMNDLQYFGGYWYATSTVPCTMIRFRDIDRIGKIERLAGELKLCDAIPRSSVKCSSGTPYFLSVVDQVLYIPFIFGCSGIMKVPLNPKQQQVQQMGSSVNGLHDVGIRWDLAISNASLLFGTGWVEAGDDVARRGAPW
jgi:hypothetical protein